MARYDRYDFGYRRQGGPYAGDWSNPYGGGRGWPYDRQRAGERPWVGDHENGYQGGMGGMPTGRGYDAGYQSGMPGPRGYDGGYRGGMGGATSGRSRGMRDEWWLGGHHPGRYDEDYDRAYQEFDRQNRPRFSPVGGTYHAMGGSYEYGRTPRPLRDGMWFSDWTRWF